MLPSPRFRIVGVRADGSTRVLCAEISDPQMAQRVASGLGHSRPFTRIVVEPDGGDPSTSERRESTGDFGWCR